ncbi:MAG: ribosomal RNA small subunit methyltransferase A, partial [Chloroflexi bacterium]|nr:ribosomal RNA small subunit methyltransferase A [Chloroflexota bacterium]
MGVAVMDWRATLRRFGVTPKKSLGQNFLFDEAVLDRIVAAGEVTKGDTVLEVGPGAGSLTRQLARAAGRVVAVELDDRLLPVLAHTLADCPNVAVIHGDILKLQPGRDYAPPGKVVANIPYYLTSTLIRHLLEADARPSVIVLTVQREVAHRICAAPPDMSLLAVSVQFYGAPRLMGYIPAGAFYPPPDVDSAIVRIDLAEPPLSGAAVDKFFRVVKAGFGQKRKQLKNSLLAGLGLKGDAVEAMLREAGIDPTRRAETLSLAEWLRLYRS